MTPSSLPSPPTDQPAPGCSMETSTAPPDSLASYGSAPAPSPPSSSTWDSDKEGIPQLDDQQWPPLMPPPPTLTAISTPPSTTPPDTTPPSTAPSPAPATAPPSGGYWIRKRSRTGLSLILSTDSDAYELRLSTEPLILPNGSDAD